jgi:hypothetical protein
MGEQDEERATHGRNQTYALCQVDRRERLYAFRSPLTVRLGGGRVERLFPPTIRNRLE